MAVAPLACSAPVVGSPAPLRSGSRKEALCARQRLGIASSAFQNLVLGSIGSTRGPSSRPTPFKRVSLSGVKPLRSSSMPNEIVVQAAPNVEIPKPSEHGSQPQTLIIPNKEGEKLVGLFNFVGGKSVSILCHGFRSSKNSGSLTNLEKGFAGVGINTYRFDFSGNGESEGSFAFGNYLKEVEDLHSVVDHFLSQGFTVASILGHSKGGNVVLLYASKYDNVACVVNVCGRCVLTEGVWKRFGKDGMQTLEEKGSLEVKDSFGSYIVTKMSLKERFSIDMLEHCRKISPNCRVKTIHGSQDEVVPVSDAHLFASAIPNHSLKIVEGASHNFREHYSTLVHEAVSFVAH